jgi:hypothetical protein
MSSTCSVRSAICGPALVRLAAVHDTSLAAGALGILAVAYVPLFLAHMPYVANLINVPAILILGATAVALVKRGRGGFSGIARLTAVLIVANMLALCTARPWPLSRKRMQWRLPWQRHCQSLLPEASLL